MTRVVRPEPKYRPHCIILTVIALLVMAPCPGEAQSPTVFTISEAFGVSHPQQIIDFDSGVVDRTRTYMIGPNGTEVPYQVLSNGKIAVQTDLPANTQKSWKLSTGRAPGKFPNSVVLEIKPTYYEITNGVTGVRVVRPEGVSDNRLAPIQGLKLQDGRWSATGPNFVLKYNSGLYNTPSNPPLVAKTMTARIVEQGPLQVVIEVTYTYDRPAFGAPVVLIPAGQGQYKSTITLEAGQPSIQILEDTDIDVQYYLNFYPEVQQDQGRWRGGYSDSLEFGRDPITGGVARQGISGGPGDAVRDLPAKAYFPHYFTGDISSAYYGFAWTPPWNPWIRNTGWYWMLYNTAAGPEAPLVGFYSGRPSAALGAFAAGPALYGEPADATGRRSGGIGLQISRLSPDDRLAPRVKTFWAIFVGTKGGDLGDPYQIQNIHRQMNLHGGINLNKAYRYSANFSDPPGGYTSMYMDNQSMDQLIQKIRTDVTYYNYIKQSQPELTPVLDMWRDISGTQAQLVADDVTGTAQKLLNVLVNGSGVYDFYYHFWMGGLEMARRAPAINELLRGSQVNAATKQRLKAALALFASILWDDDYAPMSVNSGMSLGTANMPVQQSQYQNMYALLAPGIPGMAARVANLYSTVSGVINNQIDADGAHMGASHYILAAMEPTVSTAQQLKIAGLSNLFATEAKLSKFSQFYMDLQTPPEPRFGGLRKLVSIGDSATEGSELFGILGTGFAGDNAALSSRLMQAWLENGKPQSSFFGPSVLHINQQLPASPMGLRSTNYPGWAAILRHGFGTTNETATWFIDGDFYRDHRHADRGSLVIYALGAPLSMDWGSQYDPPSGDSFVHNDVVPEASLGVSWAADNIPLSAGGTPWTSGSSTAFESFDLSTRATAVFQGSGTTWTRTVRTIAPNASYPVITIADTFSGTNAGAGKVFNLNLMAQGAVQSTAGTVNPVLRTTPELPSTSSPLSLSAGLNHFSFSGQWLIDWDLYQTATETQQVVIGNWAHKFENTSEGVQFQSANGRTFEERQHIFRMRGTSGFNVLILPYRKGTQRSGISVTNSGGVTTVAAPGEQTLISDTFYAYQSSQQTVLTTNGSAAASSYDIQINGGPTEVVLTPGKAVITAHGAPGVRTIQLPGSWQMKAPLTISNGVISFNYQGGAPVRVELGP